jgi:hypothetical protein
MSFDNGPVHAAGETEIIRIYDQTAHGASLAGRQCGPPRDGDR